MKYGRGAKLLEPASGGRFLVKWWFPWRPQRPCVLRWRGPLSAALSREAEQRGLAGSATWRWPPPVPRQRQDLVLCGAGATRATAQGLREQEEGGRELWPLSRRGSPWAALPRSPELSARPPRWNLLLLWLCVLTPGLLCSSY